MEFKNSPCTLVVTGAGASVDCYSTELKQYCFARKALFDSLSPDQKRVALNAEELDRFFPPLTKDLVSALRVEPYKCSSLLTAIGQAQIVQGSHFDFEAVLRDLFINGQYDDQFLELRKSIVNRIGQSAKIGTSLPTLYTDLYARLKTDAHIEDRQFAFLNVNYDPLLEYALTEHAGYSTIDEYAAKSSRFRLYHPHGSTRWVIAPVLKSWNDHLRRYDNDSQAIGIPFKDDSLRLPPAIALPMSGDPEGKMVWPQQHFDSFREQLPQVDKIIVIGWRGADTEIVDMVSEYIDKAKISSVELVTHGSEAELQDNIQTWVPDHVTIEVNNSGFFSYMSSYSP